MTKVKICGITSVEDGLWVVECGADAIGLNFAESPRRVDVARAREILGALPGSVVAVGVFADASKEEMRGVAQEVGLGTVQVHGKFEAEEAEELREGGLRVVRAIQVGSRADLKPIGSYPADAFLLDTKAEGMHGGTGKTFDWSLAREARERARIVLAGGLGPDNVAEAIREVRPWAVDASSRLEASPGVKDPALVKRFIEAVREAEVSG